MTDGRLAGKIALITGAAQGIGAAHARLFAAAGARLVIGDINPISLRALAEDIRAAGGSVEAIDLDVTQAGSWTKAVECCEASFGGLTTLINNAGIYHPIGIEQESRAGWDKTIAVNQTGVFLGMQACLPLMQKSGHGTVVNIASLLGLIGSYRAFAYHASKAAIRMMSKAASLELAGRNIRVNSVYPGSILTPIIGNMTQEERDMTIATIPLGRWGRPEDVAHASLFLCSDEAAYITGAEISVDGGYNPAA